MAGKQRCKKCGGRGGWYYKSGPLGFEHWRACLECMGKGTWWPNSRKKPVKK